jgi:beta-glucanase (GH16 family)
MHRSYFLALMLAFAAPAEDKWVLTFSEEFPGKELSFPKWTPHDPWGRERNREGQAYVPEAIEVKNGAALITARRESAKYDGRQREFTSGILTTMGSFAQAYGRFEIRCRVASGKGVESKFWLMPVPSGEVPAIDVLDVVGSDTKTALFGNRWGDEKTERSYSGTSPVPDMAADFHTVMLEWDEKHLVWSVDGKEKFESVSGAPRQPMYLAIGLAVGGLTAKYPDSSVKFPMEFEIQSVKVYQLASRLPK